MKDTMMTMTNEVMPLPHRYGGGYLLSCATSATLNGRYLPVTVKVTKGEGWQFDGQNRAELAAAPEDSVYVYTFHECWNVDGCYQEWGRDTYHKKGDGEWVLVSAERA